MDHLLARSISACGLYFFSIAEEGHSFSGKSVQAGVKGNSIWPSEKLRSQYIHT